MTSNDDLTIQISILLGGGSTRATSEVPTYGLSDGPTPEDPMTKAEANYRPAYLDPEEQQNRREVTRDLSTRARGRMDHMEIPRGAPSEEGDPSRVYPARTYKRECGTCEHFFANSCDIVAGTIDHEYVCDWWEED